MSMKKKSVFLFFDFVGQPPFAPFFSLGDDPLTFGDDVGRPLHNGVDFFFRQVRFDNSDNFVSLQNFLLSGL